MLRIKSFIVNPLGVNCYVVSDESKEAVLIDPGMFATSEWDEAREYIRSEGLSVRHCLLTHCHFDHIMGCHYVEHDLGLAPEGHADDVEQYKALAKQTRAFLGMSLNVPEQPSFGRCLNEGSTVEFGNHSIAVMHTPGHSKGCVCYYIPSENVIFTGDTLFSGSMGRTDLQGGNDTEMRNSLLRLSELPDTIQVYPGHGTTTSIENEKGWIQVVCKR